MRQKLVVVGAQSEYTAFIPEVPQLFELLFLFFAWQVVGILELHAFSGYMLIDFPDCSLRSEQKTLFFCW